LDKENRPTVAMNQVVLVTPPLDVPVTVMLYRPTFGPEEVVSARLLEKGGVPEGGVNEHEIAPPVPPVQARFTGWGVAPGVNVAVIIFEPDPP